jgi:hypothetical protein
MTGRDHETAVPHLARATDVRVGCDARSALTPARADVVVMIDTRRPQRMAMSVDGTPLFASVGRNRLRNTRIEISNWRCPEAECHPWLFSENAYRESIASVRLLTTR